MPSWNKLDWMKSNWISTSVFKGIPWMVRMYPKPCRCFKVYDDVVVSYCTLSLRSWGKWLQMWFECMNFFAIIIGDKRVRHYVYEMVRGYRWQMGICRGSKYMTCATFCVEPTFTYDRCVLHILQEICTMPKVCLQTRSPYTLCCVGWLCMVKVVMQVC